ncbi:MAG: large subunit ribosomal protein [Acidobacteriota bacterium]|nr:large subunit ribosomal protein [Acidobacteriota bacterium]
MAEEKKDANAENIEEQKSEETTAEPAEVKREAKSPAKETAAAKEKEDKKKTKEKVKKSTVIRDLSYFSEVRKDLPEIKPGDVLRVSYRVIEGGKERIQVFEGTVIAIKNSGVSKTITVRKTSFGIAVERIFPLNSKLVQGIEVKKHSKVRRAKLYYLRELKGKAARLREFR